MNKTSKQMLEAPPNAIFVWHSADVSYPRRLARYLDREDLTIVPSSTIRNGIANSTRLQIVLDHRVKPEWDLLEYVNIHNAKVLTLRSIHEGWLLFCPVTVYDLDRTCEVVPRYKNTEWLLNLALSVQMTVISILSYMDEDYVPSFMLSRMRKIQPGVNDLE